MSYYIYGSCKVAINRDVHSASISRLENKLQNMLTEHQGIYKRANTVAPIAAVKSLKTSVNVLSSSPLSAAATKRSAAIAASASWYRKKC